MSVVERLGYVMVGLDPVVVTEMRGWLSDLEWADIDAEDIAEYPDTTIIRAVGRFYSGGVDQFVRDSA